jgi:glucose/arabinose dehydrogenase
MSVTRSQGVARANVLVAAIAVIAAIFVILRAVTTADAEATLPSGFDDSVVLSGLDQPTNVEFSQDGRVFVAEKSGLTKVFDNLSDRQPTIFADLRTQVHNYWDRGLLGLALGPGFPARPYVYALYTYDAPSGESAPRWGAVGATSDGCPTPPGPTADGCVVSGRLSRLEVDVATNTMTGAEKVLIEGWCQQFPSHSVGDLAFGSDGKLYVSGGDGAGFWGADYGQAGGTMQDSPTPRNPCGDPPTGVGGTQSPPTAEGGSLHS